MRQIFQVAASAFLLLLAIFSNAQAQRAPASNGAAPAEAEEPRSRVAVPSAKNIVLLLRTTLLTLNDALETGNFTVLRDKGAPGFRKANTAARLAQAFSDLTPRGVDLSAVSVVAPQLTEPPELDQQKGMLRLKGYFPVQRAQINFEVLYQATDGRWRLFGISVNPSRAAQLGARGPALPLQRQGRPVAQSATGPAAQEPAVATNLLPSPPLPSRKPP